MWKNQAFLHGRKVFQVRQNNLFASWALWTAFDDSVFNRKVKKSKASCFVQKGIKEKKKKIIQVTTTGTSTVLAFLLQCWCNLPWKTQLIINTKTKKEEQRHRLNYQNCYNRMQARAKISNLKQWLNLFSSSHHDI